MEVPDKKNLKQAEEEWIRQMFSGTIHNIGNVITVARLAVNELEEASKEKEDVLAVILNELLPPLKEHKDNGTLSSFLSEGAGGAEYIDSVIELLNHQKTLLITEQQEIVGALNGKLDHITEIVELQQRLVSGIGKEDFLSIKSMVKDALKMMNEALLRHVVDLEEDYIDELDVEIDGSMVIQVFINIFKNDIEAFDEGSINDRKMKIVGQREKGTKTVACRISDNGPGIAPEHLDKIFNYGYTTKISEQYGRGVGLHFCKQTLEKYGIEMAVESELGKGTCFVIYFPIRQGGLTAIK